MGFFSLKHARAFVDLVKTHRLEALFQVALLIGMRQGELLGLRWRDIDFENGRLTVRNSLLWYEGKFHLAEPKTQKGNRLIPLPTFALQALLRHQALQEKQKLVAGTRWVDWDLVFPTSIGTPMHRRNLLRTYYSILRISDLPRIRFHDLRHSAAAIWISQGAAPKLVQDLLGHADFATTMNLYGHLFEEMKTEMAGKVDALFSPVAVRMAVQGLQKKPN
jgi:integrase